MIAASLKNDMQRINIVANNAANALTPGFKREIAALTGVQNPLANTPLAGSTQVGLPFVASTVDPSQGVLKQTGRGLDVAISGNGFFEVNTPTGTAYTRHGAFQLDEAGRVVTAAGYPVSGAAGEIVLRSSDPLIDRTGRISVAGSEVGQFRVVSIANPQDLSSVGGGLFIASENAEIRDVDRPQIFQGQLESSNVDATREMVQLMEIYRHFEASSRVLQAYGDLKESTFSTLGTF